jgi:cell division protein FtsI/penicillin-binding protein 2
VSEPWATGSRIKYGTGDYEPIFTSAGVIGKTGTAQAPPWPRDVDGDGVISPGESVSGLEHAWFVGLVGAETGPPQFAIAVIVEFGGSGGRVAGPVANQIIEALKQTGYLQQVPSVVGVNR